MSLTHIKQLNYNEASNVLRITFKGGSVYSFRPVNPETYTELIRADCLARAVHKAIRKGTVVGVRNIK